MDPEVFAYESDMDESESENEDLVKKTKIAKKVTRQKVTRQRWDATEMEEIHKYFSSFLEAKIVPRTKDVQLAQKKSKQQGGKIWKRTSDKVVKKISNINHKN